MYVRNAEIQECWEKDEWYGISDTSDVSERFLYNPDDEAVDKLLRAKGDGMIAGTDIKCYGG
ncbi:MAG: hypothetical protein NC489_27660 [Ruminococcus flavefaciens]|nr:hypothetical protein [Ruminococcus flavefaciens]